MAECKWCEKAMRTSDLKRHIGIRHEEKANEKELEAARKSRIYKWVICDRCGGSKLK